MLYFSVLKGEITLDRYINNPCKAMCHVCKMCSVFIVFLSISRHLKYYIKVGRKDTLESKPITLNFQQTLAAVTLQTFTKGKAISLGKNLSVLR